MTDAVRTRPDYLVYVRYVILAILAASILPFTPQIVRAAQHYGFHPHLPELGALAALPIQIQIHIAAATTAFLIGCIILLRPKGTGFHKTLGWTWVGAMATTAVSSFFIRELNPGAFSLVHLISGYVVIALPMALVAIRRGNVAMHRRAMTALFTGGLLIAGSLAFLPGRLMYKLFFG